MDCSEERVHKVDTCIVDTQQPIETKHCNQQQIDIDLHAYKCHTRTVARSIGKIGGTRGPPTTPPPTAADININTTHASTCKYVGQECLRFVSRVHHRPLQLKTLCKKRLRFELSQSKAHTRARIWWRSGSGRRGILTMMMKMMRSCE